MILAQMEPLKPNKLKGEHLADLQGTSPVSVGGQISVNDSQTRSSVEQPSGPFISIPSETLRKLRHLKRGDKAVEELLEDLKGEKDASSKKERL